MSTTTPYKKRKREEWIDDRCKVRTWLAAFERSNKLENTKTEENDIGTIGFMVHGKSYSIPFTGLLKMTDARKENDPQKFNSAKKSIEQNFGPVRDIAPNLKILAKFLEYGAGLMCEAGFETIAEGDLEMRSSSDSGADHYSGCDEDSS